MRVFIETIGGERATLEVGQADTLRRVQEQVKERLGVPPEEQLLSLKERQILGEDSCKWSALQPPIPEKATLCLTDYTSLRPHGGGCCRIAETARRGLSVKQLDRLLGFIRRYCSGAGGSSPKGQSGSQQWWYGRDGAPLAYATMNLYDVAQWVIRPATRSERCSFVEFIAIDCEIQSPTWYVSHWWGETVLGFASCLRSHAEHRGLGDTAVYWICAYANNQWELGFELKPNPKDTSFFRALQRCDGMLVVLDREAVVFDRAWCCYELACAVSRPQQLGRQAPLRLDIATTLPPARGGNREERTAAIITDGLTLDEEMREVVEQGDGWRGKAEREELFPLKLIERAFGINIESSKVSEKLDKRRILNSIAGVGAGKIDGHPPLEHERYRRVNRKLAAIFAVAGWRGAVRQADRTAFVKTVKADEEREELRLSLVRCPGLSDERLRDIAAAMPPGLKEVALDIRSAEGGRITDRGVADIAGALPPSLERLHLNLSGCGGVDDRALTHLKSSTLQHLSELRLHLAFCDKVGDKGVSHLVGALPVKLKHLELNLRGCTRIGQAGTAAAIRGIPKGLNHLLFDINGLKAMTNTELQTLADHIPTSLSFLSLHFRRSSAMNNVGLARLAKALPAGLRQLALELEDCGSVSGDGFAVLAAVLSKKPLASGLRSLRLDFVRSSKLGGADLVGLANALPRGLACLELSFEDCKCVDDDGAAAIARAISATLRHLALDLSGCDGVTDRGLGCLADSLHLELVDVRLGLAKCNKVTDKGLIRFVHRLPPRLQGLALDVRQCAHIGDIGLLGIVEALPTWLRKTKLLFAGSGASRKHVERLQGARMQALQEWQRELSMQQGDGANKRKRSEKEAEGGGKPAKIRKH